MLYNYKEVIEIYGTDYKLKQAIANKKIYRIESGIYSDKKDNFTTYELVLKKYQAAFLVKNSALYHIGFIEKENNKRKPANTDKPATKRAKQQKILVAVLSDRVKTVMCDEVFLDRIKGFKKALDDKTISQEEYDKIVADIYKEREKEMFPNE